MGQHDGQFNSIVGTIFFQWPYGIWGTISLSESSATSSLTTTKLRNGGGGIAEILAVGAIAHSKIATNYIWGGPVRIVRGYSSLRQPSTISATTLRGHDDEQFWSSRRYSFRHRSGILIQQTGIQPVSVLSSISRTNAGTIQHSIIADTANSTLNLACSRIKNASASFTTTPTGADNATAMAAGAKISSANTNQVIFDTAAQYNLNGFLQTVWQGTHPVRSNVVAFVASVNVNGSP